MSFTRRREEREVDPSYRLVQWLFGHQPHSLPLSEKGPWYRS